MQTDRPLFFSKLPSVTAWKFGKEAETFQDKQTHLKHLVAAHAGELVDTGTPRRWKLFPAFGQSVTAQGWDMEELSQSLTADPCFHPQFFLNPGGFSREELEQDSHLKETLDQSVFLCTECKRVMALEKGLTLRVLLPAWELQKFTIAVPCRGTNRFFWGRIGRVVSLAKYFDKLYRPSARLTCISPSCIM